MRIPKYRRHRRPGGKDKGFVEYRGKRHYLPNSYQTPESRAAYGEFVQAVIAAAANDRPPARRKGDGWSLAGLVIQYIPAIEKELLEEGRETELGHVKRMLRRLLEQHGETPVDDFGPLALEEFRDRLLETKIARKRLATQAEREAGAGRIIVGEADKTLSRTYVKDQVARVVRMFKWAVRKELVSAEQCASLSFLKPLRKYSQRGKGRPGKRIMPAPPDAVEAVVTVCSPTVAAMILLQQVTGMRPNEVCLMRPCDIDQSSEVWAYLPREYKGQARDLEEGVEPMPVFLGPRAQDVMKPFLDRPDDAHLFSPRESRAWYNEQRWDKAGTAKRRAKKASRVVGTVFDPRSYRQSVVAACKKAGVAPWSPYQLRHFRATQVREKYSLEGAQVALRHKHAKVTEVYARRNLTLARRIALEAG